MLSKKTIFLNFKKRQIFNISLSFFFPSLLSLHQHTLNIIFFLSLSLSLFLSLFFTSNFLKSLSKKSWKFFLNLSTMLMRGDVYKMNIEMIKLLKKYIGDRRWIARALDSSSVQQEFHRPGCKLLFLVSYFLFLYFFLTVFCVWLFNTIYSLLCLLCPFWVVSWDAFVRYFIFIVI